MSVITYYQRCAPDAIDAESDFDDGGETIDLDKASEVISWLLSPCKRAEQVHFAAIVESREPMDPKALPPIPPIDDFAIAVEGRGSNQEETHCYFEPHEVIRFAKLLGTIDVNTLRRNLDFKAMDAMHLPLDNRMEEGEELFTEYIVPLFEKLKQFYQRAANARQAVMVWHE